jgi:hypothetical protein
MSEFKQLWTKLARFAEALEGMDDATGDYVLSLSKRVDKLEREVEHLHRLLHSSVNGGIRL